VHAASGGQCRFGQTVAREGVMGLYKGVTPPLLMTGFINAALFGMQVPRTRPKAVAGEHTVQGRREWLRWSLGPKALGRPSGVDLLSCSATASTAGLDTVLAPAGRVAARLDRRSAERAVRGARPCARARVRRGGGVRARHTVQGRREGVRVGHGEGAPHASQSTGRRVGGEWK
jgi:hypothetical protein